MGKTSLYNMLCGTNAPVSIDAHPCTRKEAEAPCNLIGGQKCTVRDTCGLPEEGSGSFMKFMSDLFGKSTTKGLQKRLKKLRKEGELHLLIYCMSTHSRNKKNSHEKHYKMLTSVGVPVVVVVTNLELQPQDISSDDWWSRNKGELKEFGMNTDTTHGCGVTTLPKRDLRARGIEGLYDESRKKVKNLISNNIL